MSKGTVIGLYLCGATGLASAVLTGSLVAWHESKFESISEKAEIARREMEQQKKTEEKAIQNQKDLAEAKAKAGIVSFAAPVMVGGYTLDERIPPTPEQGSWKNVKADGEVIIVDQTNQCVGYLSEGTLYTRYKYNRKQFPDTIYDPQACDSKRLRGQEVEQTPNINPFEQDKPQPQQAKPASKIEISSSN